MNIGKTVSTTFAGVVLAACTANATYYSATVTGSAALSALEWSPKKPASFAAGDTLRIVSRGGGNFVAVDEVLENVYLKFDVPENDTLTVTFEKAYGGEGSLYKLGEGTLVYRTASGVVNTHGKTIVQAGTFKFGEGCSPLANIYVRTDATLDVNGQYSTGTKLYLSDRSTLTNTGADMTAGSTLAEQRERGQFSGGIYLDKNAVVNVVATSQFGFRGNVSSQANAYTGGLELKMNDGMIVKRGAKDFTLEKFTYTGSGSSLVYCFTGGGVLRIEEGKVSSLDCSSGQIMAQELTLDIREGCAYENHFISGGHAKYDIRFKNIFGSGTIRTGSTDVSVSVFGGTLDAGIQFDSNTPVAYYGGMKIDISGVDGTYAVSGKWTPSNNDGTLTFDLGNRRITESTKVVSWTTKPATTIAVAGKFISGNYTIDSDGITVTPLDADKELTYTGASVTLAELPPQKILRFESDSDQTLLFSGITSVPNAYTIEKAGSGTLTLSGTDGLTIEAGNIVVSEGTLKLNWHCRAPVTVAKGATLDVNGKTTVGKVTLEDGAILANSTAHEAASTRANSKQNFTSTAVRELALAYCATGIVNCAAVTQISTTDMNYGALVKRGAGQLKLGNHANVANDVVFSNHGALVVEAGGANDELYTKHIDASGLTVELANGASLLKDGRASFRRIAGAGNVHSLWGPNCELNVASGIDGSPFITRTVTGGYTGICLALGDGSDTVINNATESYLNNTTTIGDESRFTIARGNRLFLCNAFATGSDNEIGIEAADTTLGYDSTLTLGVRSVMKVTKPMTAGSLALAGDALVILEGDGAITFGDSSAAAWNGTLTIVDNTGRAGSTVGFGSPSGLTAEQLAGMTYNGRKAVLDPSGFLRVKFGFMIVIQ